MTMIALHNSTESIDVDTLTFAGAAQPTNLAGEENCYIETATLPNERKVQVYYGFSEQEVVESNDEPSNLPFDNAHITRIEAK